ncbi:biliverdin-producing heme oxygenase [Mycetocola tolaasinivorans]|uniref:heme oxygenase (biliverdin-producing) n=1 Tax=Mycetocola tolaasinivorans TaxID=76635 RepID=A0A3L7A637_9MICO|nr:biliverdin-producing heme oxygenase [Mycetocola tolaasinivorans]RLP75290.1 biliverdin-producing heme oxygenase [Mycetocola tolaasinivorans]
MTDVTPFSTQVRERTATDHSSSEGADFMADLMRGRGTREDYAALTAQHFFIYEALEAAADAQANDPVAGAFVFESLRRLPSLERDLEFLLGDGWREQIAPLPTTVNYVARINEVGPSWAGGLIAHHYTRYLGDLSGGQYIARLMKRQFELDERGIEFYAFPEIEDAAAFKDAYRALLDGLELDDAERERVIEEIVRAYAYNTELFVDLTAAKAAAAA